jgi:hypothetical protein
MTLPAAVTKASALPSRQGLLEVCTRTPPPALRQRAARIGMLPCAAYQRFYLALRYSNTSPSGPPSTFRTPQFSPQPNKTQ